MKEHYSELLNLVLAHSRNLEIGIKGAVTPEKLLLAVFQIQENDNLSGEEAEELAVAMELLNGILPDTARAKKSLSEIADDAHDGVEKQVRYMNSVLAAADAAAGNHPGTAVTLGAVLATIFSFPTENLQKCVDEQQAVGQKEETPEEEPHDSGLGWLSGAISAFNKDKAASSSKLKERAQEAPEENADAESPERQAAEDIKEDAAEEQPATGGKKDEAAEIVPKLVVRINSIRDCLLNTVFGQDHAIDVLTTGLFQGEYLARTDKNRKRPKATFLFAGSPGVGKTFLAERVAEELNIPYRRFDMSEYAMKPIHEDLLKYVKHYPKGVILFDEIEKAHYTVIQTFLQVLDLGEIGGSDGASFRDCVLIFTTNAGRLMYEESESGDFSDVSNKVVVSALRNDINERTGEPYFPAPLCSRFESGNVVMFNRMTAHILRKIAETEIRKQVKNIVEISDIDISIEERVYTTLLFSEGGNTDARTVRARAEKFVNNELYELFRMLKSSSPDTLPKSILFRAKLPQDNEEIMRLFRNESPTQVLLFAGEAVCRRCEALCPEVNFCCFSDPDTAITDLYKNDYKLALIDFAFGQTDAAGYLNDEDIESVGRVFFRKIRSTFSEIPVYFLQTEGENYDAEERLSLQRRGVRDVLELPADGGDFAARLSKVCEQVYCQDMMKQLARGGKLLSFETGQRLEAGNRALVELFDFRLEKVIEAQDAQAVLSDSELPNTSFDDVIGAGEAKEELQFYVDFLKNPKKFAANGVETPKGVLLYGPPGTGKTMLARALAGEAGVAFLPVSASSFMNKYVGESPATVRRLFAQARKYAPSVIFIDEIDAIAKERTGSETTHVEEQTLNELLTQMDGFNVDPKRPVFVLAATNYTVDGDGDSKKALDPALLRRFDRRIKVDLPNREDRLKYLKIMTKKGKFELSEALFLNIAKRSVGMSLAQLESVIKMAKRTASRLQADKIDDELFENAFEEFLSGEEHEWSEKVMLSTARHEAGHAFVSWYCGEKPAYMTIVSRGNYGGYVQRESDEERFGYNRSELRNLICISLAGRAAELVDYGGEDGVTTGPGSDLRNATRTAIQMLCDYGMSDKFGLAVTSPYSNETGTLDREVRDEVNAILGEELQRAVALITAHKEAMDALVEELMQKTHLNGEEINAILSQYASPEV